MNRFSKIYLWLQCVCIASGTVFILYSASFAGSEFLCKKEIPKITLKNMSPPYKDFLYFQYTDIFPFDYKTEKFSLCNAWWLAEVSTLVYADENYVRQRFTDAGLTRVRFIENHGTQCFVASNEQFGIIAFRGSEIWKRRERFDPSQMVADMRTNIDVRLAGWMHGGSVHSGFKSALDDIWPEILREVRYLEENHIRIWLTGHSLGAALATLAADRLGNVQGVYTFGSPRVGDRTFQENFSPKAFRVVNGNDIVASVPPPGLYYHVGEFVHLSSSEEESVERNLECQEFDSSNSSSFESTKSEDQNSNFSASSLIPAAIRDHVPLLYSILLWNELVEEAEIN